MKYTQMTFHEIKEGYERKDFKPSEVVGSFLEQIEKHNKSVNAVVSINDKILDQAKKEDEAILAGQGRGPLSGLPLAVKEMFCTKGLKTTACSKILENFVPPYSATVIEKLESAGAWVLCKTNQDEFAMGSSNEVSHFGSCKNPWDLERVPGGSSGGSAAAVAAGMAPVSLGTDTGGSIRQPASFCNVVGFKPTYGRVSRYGIIAFASSLDQAGPMARSVKDAALVLENMCGHDIKDGTTARAEVPAWSKNLNSNLKGVRVGLLKEFNAQLSPDTQKVLSEGIDCLKAAGAELVEVSMPLTEMSVPIYYLVAASEASSNLARYDGVRYGFRADFSKEPAKDLAEFYSRTRAEGFGTEVKRRIILGTYCLSSGYYDAYYKKACQVRRLLRDQFLQALEKCDVIFSPVTSTPAFKIGSRIDDPLQMYLNDIFTTTAPLVGAPGMSVPAGFSSEGLPIGLQLSARHFDEQKIFNVGLALEEGLKAMEKFPNGI